MSLENEQSTEKPIEALTTTEILARLPDIPHTGTSIKVKMEPHASSLAPYIPKKGETAKEAEDDKSKDEEN